MELLQKYNANDVKRAMFEIDNNNNNNSPSPYGYGSGFSKASWNVIGQDISAAIFGVL